MPQALLPLGLALLLVGRPPLRLLGGVPVLAGRLAQEGVHLGEGRLSGVTKVSAVRSHQGVGCQES